MIRGLVRATYALIRRRVVPTDGGETGTATVAPSRRGSTVVTVSSGRGRRLPDCELVTCSAMLCWGSSGALLGDAGTLYAAVAIKGMDGGVGHTSDFPAGHERAVETSGERRLEGLDCGDRLGLDRRAAVSRSALGAPTTRTVAVPATRT